MRNQFPLIDPVKAGICILGGIILALAGFYLGSFFLLLFLFYLLLPLLAFVQFAATAIGLRHYQDFSTNHPIKGQKVVYRLILTNASPLPTSHINIRFKAIQEDFRADMLDFSLCMRRHETYESTHDIACPFRGVYTVGLESLEVEDLFRIFSIRLPVWYRTFYVYPRIVELRTTLQDILGNTAVSSGSSQGTIHDYSRYESLSDYRHGAPIRHIAWKKFAALGEPYLKTYEKSARPGTTLYLDTRRDGRANEQILLTEDCSVEIMVAITGAFNERGIPIRVRAAGWHEYSFGDRNADLFERFHRATITIEFGPAPSPRDLFTADVTDNRMTTHSIIVVTHRVDPELLALATREAEGQITTALVMNLSGLDEEWKARTRELLAPIADRGGTVYRVESPEAIQDAFA